MPFSIVGKDHSGMHAVPMESLVSRYFAAINAADYDALDSILADDFALEVAGRRADKDSLKGFQRMFRAGFPNISVDFELLVTTEDFAVARTSTTGTHAAEFLGHPPTQRTFTASGIDVFRAHDGLIAAHWGEFDTFGMLQQLGLAGAPGDSTDAR